MKKLLIVCLMLISTQLLAQKEITIRNLMDGTFYARRVSSLDWTNNGASYVELKDNKVVRNSILANSQPEVIFDGSQHNLSLQNYSFSSDEQKLLLMTNRRKIYRRSYTAKYYVYNINTKELKELSSGDQQAYATFSPDGSKVAFTRKNNLFVTDLQTMKEKQLTTDGKFNSIINGSTDWVYEEEFSITKAFAWSPDSKKIAYLKSDESQVKRYNMQEWKDGALYPNDYVYKYPKAGEANSTVEVYVYHLDSNKNVRVDTGKEKDIYIPRLGWTKDPGLLYVQRINRLQNQMDLLHANAETGESRLIISDKSDTYVDITFTDDLMYLDNGKQFLLSSEKDGYKHFYLYNLDGSLVNQVTRGNFEAQSLVAVDQSSRKPVLYYLSREDSPLELHLYRVRLDGKKKEKLSQLPGKVTVDMSKDNAYYVLSHQSAEEPLSVSLYRTADNTKVKDLVNNSHLKETAKAYGISKKNFFTFRTVDNSTLNGYFLYPHNFDSAKTYPVLLYQYSGPGSQNVENTWSGSHYYWHQMLAAKGYIIAVVDTRGTGGRGAAFKKMTYKQLGKLEAQDHIEAAKFFRTLPFVDGERLGIWGWSYGGYMSSLVMMKGADYFKAGIAVAPVTTWRFYDTIYTERYLQRPQDNPSGYDDNSPNTHAALLKGKFLLIHGTGDDNVHFQNAVTLQNKLVAARKNFQSFYYPDQAHGLSGVRDHVYGMMTEFILENL